jgi:hypothetical protein
MATTGERVSVLETQVINIDEKIDDLKVDVRELDHKIVTHTETLKTQLTTMYDASCTQHAELAKKIGAIEKFKRQWTWMIMGGSVVGGWMLGHLSIVESFIK